MAEAEISLFQALSTQRAIRSFKHEPVPRELITKAIEYATISKLAPEICFSEPRFDAGEIRFAISRHVTRDFQSRLRQITRLTQQTISFG